MSKEDQLAAEFTLEFKDTPNGAVVLKVNEVMVLTGATKEEVIAKAYNLLLEE